MIRQVDGLGRVVLPMDYRKALDVHDGDELEIILKRNKIIIKKSKTNIPQPYPKNRITGAVLRIVEKDDNP